MKILFLVPYFYPHIGGVEKHVLKVSKKLVERGHEVIVLCEKSSIKEKKSDIIHQIKVYRFSTGGNDWFKKFRIWRELWKKRRLILESDVVHCHDVFFWFLPFRFLYPRMRIYTTFHGYEGKYPISKKAFFIRKISEELSLGNISVGKYIKKWYGTKPTFVTYGAVNLQNSRPKDDRPLAEKLKILLIGRLEEDIGVRTYLKALEFLKEKGIKFTFSAVGDGSLKKHIQKFGKVHGFVKNIKTYIRKTDLVFASSYLSILQALANKKAVFSVYDNPLKRDYLKMTPFKDWIVIKNNPDELSLEIQKYLKNPNKYNSNIDAAYKWVSRQSWDKLVNLYLRLWK